MLCLAILAAGRLALPTGAQLLQRCQKAYDSVRTFEEDVRGSMPGAGAGTAHISFVRPNRLRVAGKSLFGSPYDLVSDGRATWIDISGNWTKQQNAEMGIASITGISGNAGTMVPSTLLHARWGSFSGLSQTKLAVSTDKVNGRPTYRIRSTGGAIPTTLWIDAGSSFLVKTSADAFGRTITVDFAPPKVNRPIPASRFTHHG